MGQSYLLGVDIGGTKCTVVLGDDSVSVIDRSAFATRAARGPGPIIDEIVATIGEVLQRNAVPFERVKGLGISCGGPLDPRTGVVMSPPNLPGWDNVPLVELLSRACGGLPTYLQNDANAGAVAEWKAGAGQGARHMIFITFGTGLGAGLILNGRLYSGACHLAGEIGHIRLAGDGPVGYGKAGSFEGFCSGGGIAQVAKDEILRRLRAGDTVGFCPTEEEAAAITARDVGLAAARGDRTAVEILRRTGEYLGYGLAMLIDILNPERIIIGGIFSRCREFLQPAAEEVLRRECLGPSYERCAILPAGLGELLGDYAALYVALGPAFYEE